MIKRLIKLYLGKLNRKDYFLLLLSITFLMQIVNTLGKEVKILNPIFMSNSLIIARYAAYIYVISVLAVRRLHDIGLSGIFIFTPFILLLVKLLLSFIGIHKSSTQMIFICLSLAYSIFLIIYPSKKKA